MKITSEDILRGVLIVSNAKEQIHLVPMEDVLRALAVSVGATMISQAPDRAQLDEWHEYFEKALLAFLAQEGHATQDHPSRAPGIAARKKAREDGHG